mmetsp:Transcript_55933/g.62605  ORF Transcript_55933/g.62605 Transcript_55933/m.62605 type:complete len:81 (+) Transcript_55933:210-452(+)
MKRVFNLLQIQYRIVYTKITDIILNSYEETGINSFGFGNSSSSCLYVCIKGSWSQPQSVQKQTVFLVFQKESTGYNIPHR